MHLESRLSIEYLLFGPLFPILRLLSCISHRDDPNSGTAYLFATVSTGTILRLGRMRFESFLSNFPANTSLDRGLLLSRRGNRDIPAIRGFPSLTFLLLRVPPLPRYSLPRVSPLFHSFLVLSISRIVACNANAALIKREAELKREQAPKETNRINYLSIAICRLFERVEKEFVCNRKAGRRKRQKREESVLQAGRGREVVWTKRVDRLGRQTREI